MKVIGLIGGMSWESSLEYYRLINQKAKEILGGFTSCECLMYSVNFAKIETLQHEGDWNKLNELMAIAATKLYRGGADIIVLCTNTMHLCSEAIVNAVPIPFLHIADATGEKIVIQKLTKVGLLGTKFTMEKCFYKEVLKDKYVIETIVPNTNNREQIHNIIYQELVLGKINSQSRETCVNVIKQLQKNGAEGIILGCTEISLLLSQNDIDIPLFDTTSIHAEKAVEWAIKEGIK